MGLGCMGMSGGTYGSVDRVESNQHNCCSWYSILMADSLLTKETILDATEDVLRRFGPEKTSVVDVARSLNVTHGTIYRHFPSKSALRLAVLKRWFYVITEPDIANEFVNHIIGSITKIVEAGISNHEFKEGLAGDIARGIYVSTIRFHHPLYSREWLIPTIQQEYDVVWNLIMSGILQ